ncbi:hypothetical protein EHV15_34275 [Paenibacillus oralis]|uniref:Uncharacterized protein n=1 Tax=Paenibacillus oralis TaxID=2490856 RepID=A0A3P3T9G7_9BACL|nr:hypothetical protein [Paenibacillus oralis]RRJ54666.1 hypothetical protein EHV15_34275 [Paenibacillus oralis]
MSINQIQDNLSAPDTIEQRFSDFVDYLKTIVLGFTDSHKSEPRTELNGFSDLHLNILLDDVLSVLKARRTHPDKVVLFNSISEEDLITYSSLLNDDLIRRLRRE